MLWSLPNSHLYLERCTISSFLTFFGELEPKQLQHILPVVSYGCYRSVSWILLTLWIGCVEGSVVYLWRCSWLIDIACSYSLIKAFCTSNVDDIMLSSKGCICQYVTCAQMESQTTCSKHHHFLIYFSTKTRITYRESRNTLLGTTPILQITLHLRGWNPICQWKLHFAEVLSSCRLAVSAGVWILL